MILRFLNKQQSAFMLKTIPWIVCISLWVLQFSFIPDHANKLELTFYDFLSTQNPKETVNEQVVVIGIDPESTKRIGNWPWLRRFHAYLLQDIGEADAIGLDLLFADLDYADSESDDSFAKAMQENGKVTLPYIYNNDSENPYEQIAPLFRESAQSVGYVNFFLDNDNVIRRLYFAEKNSLFPERIMSFPEALLDQKTVKIKKKNNAVQNFFLMLGDADGRMIPYANDQNTFPLFSYDQVLRGEISPEYFKGKVVLVGSTDLELQDRHPAPSLAYGGDLAGVLILANITNAIINDDLILIPNHYVLLFLGVLLFLVLIALSYFLGNENYFLHYSCYAIFLIALSVALLYFCRVWFPLVTLALLVLCVGLGRALIQRSSFRFMAYTDALTGLANRHSFELRFYKILEEAFKKKTPTTFILMDIDFFKKYNDTYGHDAGDIVLTKIGDVLSKEDRKYEIAARLGGEEFVLVIPNCDEEEAYNRAEIIRKAIIDLDIEHKGSDNALKKVSASFGVSVDKNRSAILLSNKIHYQEADIALYEVKGEGRNAVKVRSF